MTTLSILGFAFEKPTTKDFVWPCMFGKGEFCFNFIMLLLLIAFAATILFFVTGLRKPTVVPGKFQNLVEYGLDFVRTQIGQQMIGPRAEPFMPFLATLFFFIFFGNILEVVPGISFPLNSRLAFPLVMALTSWVLYNAVGIREHGFTGYMKMVLFPPGAPVLIYILLTPIEFLSVIVIRPITLSVRLFANMVAGHLLLSVFFLGSLALLTGFPYVAGVGSGAVAVVLVGFEIFVSALQAFIFTVLTASYIGGALASEH